MSKRINDEIKVYNCRKCENFKPLVEFPKSIYNIVGYNGICITCHTSKEKAKRYANPNRIRNKRLKRRYGLTLEEYNLLFQRQNGLCGICQQNETKLSPYGGIRPLSVDHNHTTNAVRALLCSKCNIALGFLERKGWLKLALTYLEKFGDSPHET